MNKHINDLVEKNYSDKMKDEVQKLTQKRNYEYEVLAIGLGKLAELTPQEVSKFYNAPLDFLGDIDVLIARMIVTIEKRLERNIKDEYFENVKLDNGDSEFKFLAMIMDEVLGEQ